MQIADVWIRDLPQQFQGKKYIEIFINAFARQLDELLKTFEELNLKTDLENAEGVNLDLVGNILNLTRKDAQIILMSVDNKEINDEMYRKVLKYGTLKNNSDCTYYDIVESINILWKANYVRYIESPNRPATICIMLPETSIDDADPAIGKVLTIKPAGVAMIYTIEYVIKTDISKIEIVDVSKIVFKVKSLKNNEKIHTSINLSGKIETTETIGVSAILKTNYWTLDGTYSLDGTKSLNAGIKEEKL